MGLAAAAAPTHTTTPQVLSRRLVAKRKAEAALRRAVAAPEPPAAARARKHAEVKEATELWRASDYRGAKTRFASALAAMRREHGGDDDAYARDIYAVTATLNLALVDLNLGDLDAAETGARWAQAALAALGSPQALRASHNLALILDERGAASEACALYEAVLEERRATFGRRHADALRTACNLGRLYTRLRQTDAAVELLRETRDAAVADLGPADELALAAAHNLSEALRAKGDSAEAIALARESLDTRRRVLGAHHLHTLRSSLDLARLLRSDDAREAVALCGAAASGFEKLLGGGHAQTRQASELLARWRGEDAAGAPTPAPRAAAAAADASQRVALVVALDVEASSRAEALDAVGAALKARGVAALVLPLADDDPLRDRTWTSVVGVADVDGGRRFAHRWELS